MRRPSSALEAPGAARGPEGPSPPPPDTSRQLGDGPHSATISRLLQGDVPLRQDTVTRSTNDAITLNGHGQKCPLGAWTRPSPHMEAESSDGDGPLPVHAPPICSLLVPFRLLADGSTLKCLLREGWLRWGGGGTTLIGCISSSAFLLLCWCPPVTESD